MTLTLEAPTLDDVERVRIWRNQAGHLDALRTPYRLTDEMQATFYRDVVCDRASLDRYFSVRLERQFVAFGGLTNISWENGNAEISLIVHPEHRKQGVGRLTVALLLDEAFSRLRLQAVFGEVYTCNPSAVAFWNELAHAGAWMTTILPRRKWALGRLWDSLYFSVAVEQWVDRGTSGATAPVGIRPGRAE